MPTERVVLALKSKGISSEAIAQLTEGEAWSLLYELDHKERSAKRMLPKRPEVCFTGFVPSERDELCALANNAGYSVKDSVTKNLKILVTGSNPGPSKLQKATIQGVKIVSEAEFRGMI